MTRAIARWDGAKWEGLGSGIGLELQVGAARGKALAVWGDDIYVGGTFETAGVWDSGYIARWNDNIDFSPPSVTRLVNPTWQLPSTFQCRIISDTRAAFVVERSTNMTEWVPISTNTGLHAIFTDPTATGTAKRFYRTRQIP